MKRSWLSHCVLSCALGFFLLIALPSHAAEYILKYKDQGTLLKVQLKVQQLAESGASTVVLKDEHRVGQIILLDLESRNQATTLLSLMNMDGVEYIVPNAKIKLFSAPVDAQALKEQWAIVKVQAEKAWALAGNKGSRSVVVAVIDTGVDYNHKALAPNMIPGYDFRNDDEDPMDETSYQNPGHGTHCAGVIGATGLIDEGIVGLSPEVSLMPLRFLGSDGSGDLMKAIKSIDYAIEKNAQVISASWGATISKVQAAPLIEALKRADEKGIIFVSAAANDGKDNDKIDVYPANGGFPNSITVAASNSSDMKPTWSNYGTGRVHVAAPGEAIMSTIPGDKYQNLSGTSMATPLVAGLAALLKAQDATLTGADIRAIIQSSGMAVPIQTACNCRVDALSAVDFVKNKKPVIVPAAGVLAKDETLQLKTLNLLPVTWTATDATVISVDSAGLIKGLKEGVTTIKAKNAEGVEVSTLNFQVGQNSGTKPPTDPGNPGNPGNPGDPGKCPLDDPALCDVLCKIQPTLPWCK